MLKEGRGSEDSRTGEIDMLVCFAGVDGSGKTTHALELGRKLAARGVAYEYIHLQSVFLRFLIKAGGKIRVKDGMRNHAGRASARQSIGTRIAKSMKRKTLRLLLVIDNLLFYCHKVEVRDTRILICDRYFYDSIASQESVDQKAIEILNHIYGFFLPHPDVIFFLDVESEIAHKRRPEEPLADLDRKRGVYLKLWSALPSRVVRIDTSGPFERSFDTVLSRVLGLAGDANER